MNQQIIVVAGGTGNLGCRIVKSLLSKGAQVRVLARQSNNTHITAYLEQLGAQVCVIDMYNQAQISDCCMGATCVVSALAGLEDVIIDLQKVILDAAIAAGVPRFVPSDYSLDFSKFEHGENRNLDLRRKFHAYLDTRPIRSTTVFNGAFMDMLTDQIPMIIFKKKLVLHWGSADHKLWFTSLDDTAEFTANVALDNTTPRFLRIAGEQISARQIREVIHELYGDKFRLIKTGGPALLDLIIKITKIFAPAKTELYPAWQGMQYMHNMIDKRSDLNHPDNNRYPDIHWTGVKKLLAAHKNMGI